MKILKGLGIFFLFSAMALGADITVEAYDWGYKPEEIVLKEGEPVKLTLTSKEGEHGLGSVDFKFNLKASPGKPETVEFTPDKDGIFTAKCTVPCGTGHKEMKLTIKVVK